jgi:hypothetical protein
MIQASKQLGIKEVLNLDIVDYTTRKSRFYADYAANTSIESSAERLDLRGGWGNYKLLSFDHTKDMMMSCELPLVDLEFIAFLTGKELTELTEDVPTREILTVNDSYQITLASTPVEGTLQVYILDSARDTGTELVLGTPTSDATKYSINGAVITVNSSLVDTNIIVRYDYSRIDTRKITFTADKFSGYVAINGYGLVTDQVNGYNYPTVFKILKAKPRNNWTITMSATEATTLNIEFDLYAEDKISNGVVEKVYMEMLELI